MCIIQQGGGFSLREPPPHLPDWVSQGRAFIFPFCLCRIIYKPTLQYIQKKTKKKKGGEKKAHSGHRLGQTTFATKMNPVQHYGAGGMAGQTDGRLEKWGLQYRVLRVGGTGNECDRPPPHLAAKPD